MTPLERYQIFLNQQGFYADPEQEKIVLQLEQLFEELNKQFSKSTFIKKWFSHSLIKGMYLWGPVGSGKTTLMDIFYQSLPDPSIKRWHFHAFMQEIHRDLKKFQGRVNPLKEVANFFKREGIRIICLDEFLVTDITDAMLLANLLAALFDAGITLVTTANVPPEELYKGGLQRDRFMPAIHLLQQNLLVRQLEAQRDYRLRPQKPQANYFFPLDDHAERAMQESFSHYAHYAGLQGKSLEIGGRNIPTVRQDHKVIWFDFRELCTAPRSQLDYLEIAKRFSTILLSNVPQITGSDKNSASYFIKLVDVFYDARIRLIISAAVPILEIYPEGELAKQFKRTESRLIEMQGEEYTSQQ